MISLSDVPDVTPECVEYFIILTQSWFTYYLEVNEDDLCMGSRSPVF